MKKIAFICFDNYDIYLNSRDHEDHILADRLREAGLDITVTTWKDPSIRWGDFDYILLKSPWDYFEMEEAFRQWLDRVEAGQVPLINPVEVIRWNMDKHYLKDIRDAGFSLPETVFIEKNETVDLAPFFEAWDTPAIIIKPTVSGGAHLTYKADRQQFSSIQEQVNELLREKAFLIQNYIPEINTTGEWSLIFIGGQYSHAVNKKPASEDYRVQSHHGGKAVLAEPETFVREEAGRLVRMFGKGCLYARVDGVVSGGKFLLMELELLEPLLFMRENPDSFNLYTRQLKQLINHT